MKKILTLVAVLGLNAYTTMAATPVDQGAKKFAIGYELLTQHKYQEARAAYEAGLRQSPSNAVAHFYLGETCRSLKTWACAEIHYETSLELDAQSSVAGLAKQRGRKAKVWRLLDEGKHAITDPNASPEEVAQAEDTLNIANTMGLDDEQDVIYQQLQKRLRQRLARNNGKMASVQNQDQSMAVVPAGEFTMGSSMGDADEQPEHRVYVDVFLMDKHQVSVGQYARFLDATALDAPPDWTTMNRLQHQSRPVANVDWTEADAYCTWVGKRLPTEAEWEKAARGTDGRTYPWGNEHPTKFLANVSKEHWNSHSALTPVGTYEEGKSPYGIYDMAGNVWQWVSDWYGSDYYKTGPSRNPAGPRTGTHKVIRGGSWGSNPDGLRSSDRETHLPSFRGSGTGFRCAKTP
jgi:formylglycine-generating enzyme required for sulfatase activity